MADSLEKKPGCGIFNVVFGRRRSSAGAITAADGNNNGTTGKTPSTTNSKRPRNSSEQQQPTSVQEPESTITKPPPNHPKQPIVYTQGRKPPESQAIARPDTLQQQQQQKQHPSNNNNQVGYANNQGKKVPQGTLGLSGELESMIADHQKTKGSSTFVRASSGNVMLFGNLGNIRGGGEGGGCTANSYNDTNGTDNNKASGGRDQQDPKGKYPNSVMGNVVKKHNDETKPTESVPATSLCRAVSTRMDPETLKMMGNEDYKAGNFAEALALYDAAIAIDPNKAAFRSNRSAALAALGRLLEAVSECKEAIRMEPHYHRAHHRLANLYLRLGEVDKAIYHYKHAGPEADTDDIAKAKSVQAHLNKCTEVKRVRDWNSLIKETKSAISVGADSAPQIYALQAEALLKLHRDQDADEILQKGPNFDVEACSKFFGPIYNANLLVIRAQVDIALGRFDDALTAIQKAAKLDSNNREVNGVTKRGKAVAAARANGNDHFKASRFSEACNAYGEGLDVDPYNSVLLCNRAASRSKLGQFEKAIEDCTAALKVRPGYSKARLRRADCNAKLERWDASIQDYKVLQRELPEDEEVSKALLEAEENLKRQRGGGT